MSADGRQGVTIIAFIGSVFSPYYAWRGRAEPENHISVNIALYGDGWQRWAMTERGASALSRGSDWIKIGPSGLSWDDGGALRLSLAERSVPHLAPLRGEIVLRPRTEMTTAYALDAGRTQWWRPVAPDADIDVAFERQGVSWRGAGYFDMNWGTRPLESAFRRWDWSRTPLSRGAAVLYDATRRDGTDQSLALRFDGAGGVADFDPPPRRALPNGFYGVRRNVQSEREDPKILRRLEEAPFYTRSEIATRLFGEDAHAMHETLDADRFATRWVKALLPWRMPRVGSLGRRSGGGR